MRFPHPRLYDNAHIPADSRKLARCRRFVLTEQLPDRGQRELLRVVAAKTQSISGLEICERRLKGIPDGSPAPRFLRIRCSKG